MFELLMPSNVLFGDGSIKRIIEDVENIGTKHVILFIDQAVFEHENVQVIIDGFSSSSKSTQIVNNIPTEPKVQEIEHIYNTLLIDDPTDHLVIAIGGGSTIDSAKIICAMITNPSYVEDITDATLIRKTTCDLYAVPTSAGTGSEATINSIVAIPDQKIKQGVIHPYFLPKKVYLDPELTYSLPPKLTASTGLDAFCHCIETFMSRRRTAISKVFSLEGLRLVNENIRQAYDDGNDMSARSNMLLGSFFGGVAIQTSSTVAIHALSYPLGGAFRIPHGISNAMLLPHIIEYNIDSFGDEIHELGNAMGFGLANYDRADLNNAIVDSIHKLTDDLGIPSSLAQFGVKRSDLGFLIDAALSVRRLLDQNPKEMKSDDIKRIYEKILP